jgi:hypothetical protein
VAAAAGDPFVRSAELVLGLLDRRPELRLLVDNVGRGTFEEDENDD